MRSRWRVIPLFEIQSRDSPRRLLPKVTCYLHAPENASHRHNGFYTDRFGYISGLPQFPPGTPSRKGDPSSALYRTGRIA
jgi:hypothetical protein